MQYVNNNIKIRPTTPDGILSPGQVASMTENVAKKYNWIQFDILEVKSVVLDEEEQENPNLYGAITGRMVTTQYNQSLDGEYILPFSLRDFEMPAVNELVQIFEYANPGDPDSGAEYFYIRNLAVDRSLNFNIDKYGASGYTSENEIDIARAATKDTIKKNIPLPKYKLGDRFIHGRYGHYIQFTNRDNSPCLRITNGVDEFNEGGLFDPYFDNEGSVIYLDKTPENNPLGLNRRVGLEGTDFPKLTGNQIVIESDRLIFQSKKEEVFITAAKKLDITAPEVFINGQKIVHGEILNKILEEHTKEINSISTWAMALGYMPGEKPPHPALAFLRNLMKNIFNPRKKGSPWDSPKAVPPKPRGLGGWGKSPSGPYTKIRTLLSIGENAANAAKDAIKTKPKVFARVRKVMGEAFINDKIAKPGDPLHHGDTVRTEKDAILILIDIKSKLPFKIRPSTVFQMVDPAKTRELVKLNTGWIFGSPRLININPKSGFRVEVPTGVASIKG